MSSASSQSGGNGASKIAEISGVGVKTLIIAGTAGAGGVLGVAILELVHSQPQMVLGIFREWGPLALIVMVGMFVVDRRMGENNRVQLQTAASMQRLADAVGQIADKDDERFQSLELTVGVTARNTREILDRMNGLEHKMGGG